MKDELKMKIVPVLPSKNIKRDVKWYREKAGFDLKFGDEGYVGLSRNGIFIHLQWHADTDEDPLNGGSVVKIFVEDIMPIFEEFIERGTVEKGELTKSTGWNTNEFGFYDLNKNAVFFVQNI